MEEENNLNRPEGLVEERSKQIKDLKKKLIGAEHSEAMTFEIKRVPITSVNTFRQLSNKEFVGDYGFTFKYLIDREMDRRKEEAVIGQIYAILADLDLRVAKLEGSGKKPKFKIIRMVDGTIKKIPIREEISEE